jgi:DNA-binding response OmpR family regulator
MRVLIVEDDFALGLFLANRLEVEGHDVELVPDGETGLQYALEYRPDLLVLDPPLKDGMQVLEQMRDRLGGTSILVLTGRKAFEDRVRCLNRGAVDYFTSPALQGNAA